ncbi:phosphoribosyltransferase [Pontibacter sp. KCTC 32443]|uniref:phosphoribosyltransferase n=1 Tax=Pontibacter TaxID=323449 RepID=UPI00164E24EE|nr:MULTISPECIES: phosphoribosyltransferase family protein [Pontibacter]MBC5774633.1 phosphoribosyltransferase [Pontibacter sp. KCTC 32443]
MFRDRKDAALQLAEALEKYKGKGAIVLGIPRGGAETAYYVARHLDADFSLLVARKLGHPHNPEYAVGAIAEDGSIYLNPSAQAGLSKELIERIEEQQQVEIERRVKALRNGEPLPSLKDKTVLLVDDGIATGSTVFAAIKMCRNMGAGKIVVAAPVSGWDKQKELRQAADEVVVLETPEFYSGVSQVYAYFRNLTDDEALAFMQKWKAEHQAS